MSDYKYLALGAVTGLMVAFSTLLFETVAFSQVTTAPPQLSATEQAAIHDMMVRGAQLGQESQALRQQYNQINAEFSAHHPGFHLNPNTIQVEPDAPPPTPAAPAKASDPVPVAPAKASDPVPVAPAKASDPVPVAPSSLESKSFLHPSKPVVKSK